MTDKKPFWKNGILYVYSEYYKRYVANYCPSHYLSLVIGDKQWRKIKKIPKPL